MAAMAVLFVVQLLVSSACTMVAEAAPLHAMTAPMSMDEHCMGKQPDSGSHHHACFHCDEPTQGMPPLPLLMVDQPVVVFSPLHFPSVVESFSYSPLVQRLPTGPPRSTSLIFSITQRIRI